MKAIIFSMLIILASCDSDVILLTGGTRNSLLSTAEIYPPSSSCGPLPPLDAARYGHITFTHEGQIISCGGYAQVRGYGGTNSCERMDLASNSWVQHSQLNSRERQYSSFGIIDGNPCIIGGEYDDLGYYSNALRSLECYIGGSWQLLDEYIYGAVSGSCSAQTPGGGVLIVGGAYAQTQVIERLRSGTWDYDSWPQLSRGTRLHSCSTYDSESKVMVTGGYIDGTYSTSTLIIDLNKKKISAGPDMRNKRAWHATATLGEKVYVLGGNYRDGGWHFLSSVEVFDTASGVWTELEETLTEKKDRMGTSLSLSLALDADGTHQR